MPDLAKSSDVRADHSPPEDQTATRVIFVVGVPRSGTTLLAALLCAHPAIAGTTGESWLFEQGIGELFSNFESGRHLSSYLSRPRLVALIRQLTDGVLEEMRADTKPTATCLLEKTPAVSRNPEIPLRHKLECYPDAWYIHVVRDREDTVDSLMKAGFNRDQSRHASERWIDVGLEAVRHVLGSADRYCEVRYDELSSDPRSVVSCLYGWIGLEADRGTLDRVTMLSRERYAPHRARYEDEVDSSLSVANQGGNRVTRRQRISRKVAIRRVRKVTFGKKFARAFREADVSSIANLTASRVQVTLRSPDGDLDLTGNPAREALVEISHVAFSAAFLSESWAVLDGDVVSVVFSGLRPDGNRVDICCLVVIQRGVATRVGMFSAGSLAGRPMREWRGSTD